MRLLLLPLTLLSLYTTSILAVSSTPKRGLIYIDRADNRYWSARNTQLNWYYNYGAYPTRGMEQSGLQHIPMLWGAPSAAAAGDFTSIVRSLHNSPGSNITHVLGFNEPDHTRDGGGSDMMIPDAVRIWKAEIEPLRALGIKLGSPSTVGNAGGIAWLAQFIRLCDGACHIDFIPLHYYGPVDGLARYISLARDAFRNVTDEFWLTEFALPAAPLEATQRDMEASLAMLDGAEYGEIARYSYFGSLRSSTTNTFTGPNIAFVDGSGQLTELGRTYLGDGDFGSSSSTGDAARNVVDRVWNRMLVGMVLWGVS